MSYAIVFGPRAAERLEHSRYEPFLDCIESNLARLAEDPTAVSKRSDFPFPRPGQQFDFECADGERRVVFAARFYFADNETELRMFDLVPFDRFV
jgi:hypothetical protein